MFVDLNDSELIESLKFLLVSNEEKIQMETKSFDENKHFWVPNPKTAFIGATIDPTNGNRDENGQYVTVVTDNLEVVDVKRTEILDMNSPKYDKCDDMSNMTHLNDATIIHNLKERYLDYLIYVRFPLYFFHSLICHLISHLVLNCFHFLDIFRTILCSDQSLQAIAYLHAEVD